MTSIVRIRRMKKRNPRGYHRARRKLGLRKKIRGSAERPRFCVFRSTKHIYAQVVDDESGKVLAAASTLSPALRQAHAGQKKREAARQVGKLVAARALEVGVTKVVFDRNGFLYHGRVRELAEGAREGGLEF